MNRRLLVFISSLILISAQAKAEIVTQNSQNVQAVISACRDLNKREGVCALVLDVQNLGDDAIESIKQYMDLGPREYAILTVANMIANQRLRIRSRLPFGEDIQQTIDIQKDSSTVIWEKPF